MITIKNKTKLTKSDYEQLVCLEYDLFFNLKNNLTLEELNRLFDNLFFNAIIYEIDNQIKGYCLFSFFENEAEIYKIGVSKDFQKKRIGSLLLNEIKKFYSIINLEVSNRDKTLDFYLKNDFRIIGKRKKYYADNSDAIVLIWIN